MKQERQASVILTCWRRFDNFEKIIKGWLGEKEVSEIIVWDNSGNFKTNLPVAVINSSRNYGAVIRYALAPVVKNEAIILCDDDILPHEGIAADFLKYYDYNRALGVTGRIFKNRYHSFNEYHGCQVNEAVKVDFLVGYLMMIHKEHLFGFDFSKFPWHCCELYLEGHLKDLEFLVIPTKNYEQLPESMDKNALYLQPYANEEKQKVWEDLFAAKEQQRL